MKKHNILNAAYAAALLTISAASLSSCSKVDTAHTIVFYHTMGDSLQAVLKTAVADFQAKFPGWKVSHSQIGGYDNVKEAIIGDLQAKTQPSLAYCYADHVAQYIETGKVVDMQKYINSTDTIKYVDIETDADGNTIKTEKEGLVGFTKAELDDFVPGYYAEGFATNYADYEAYGYTADSMFTLPYVKSTEVLYYNADALKELGLEVPQTWDDLWAACKKAKEKWPKCTPLGYDSEANWFITMCEQNGWGYTSADEPHYLFNNSNTVKWLGDLQTYYNKPNSFFTTQTAYGSYTSNLFVKGKEEGSIFSIGSSGGASHQASDSFKWGVAPIPGSKQTDGTIVNKAISQGPSLVMFTTNDENADEKELMTWEFVKMLLDPVYQCKFSMASGYNPARQSAFEVEEYKDFLNNKTSIVAVTANVARGMEDWYFTSPAFIGSSTARDQVGTALNYVIAGTKSPEKALADAAKKCGA